MSASPQLKNADAWLSVSGLLATVFSAQINNRGLNDRIRRIITEKGPHTLLAEAISDSLKKDSVVLEFSELRAARGAGPILAWTPQGAPFLITGRTLRGRFRVSQPNAKGEIEESIIKKRALRKMFGSGQIFVDRANLDVWDRDLGDLKAKRWFWDSIKPLMKVMRNVFLAAFVGNMLAVAVSLFALQVWDRVIPAQSTNTLSVLLIGVGIAIVFELTLRLQRASLIDDVGRIVDKAISSRVFRHMLGMKSDARPQSLGTMASQVREINQIREAFSSTVLSAAVDLPFTLVFLVVIYLILPVLIIPILVAIGAILAIGLMAQFPLARLANDGLEEAALRNGLVVESVLKSDEIKLQQAEETVQLRWERAVEDSNEISNKQRHWRNLLMNSTQSIQQLAYVCVVSLGALFVIQGDATMGQVIACSILTNRAIAPLSQVSSVMSTFQGSVAARRSINELMAKPTDIPTADHLRRELAAPAYNIKNVRYSYPGTERGALILPKLEIPFGTKTGVIGRIGSGKSTLLRLLSGLAEPTYGNILLDGTEISSIHTEDLRNAIGFQSQSAALLRGTVRDNLQIARPSATDEDMVKACEISGAISLVKDNPYGLDLQINEAGEGLSGGQRQSLLLARTILRDPPIALFDEPTASMDDESEKNFIQSLKKWSKDKTLIIATHRSRPLALVDHLLVINEGRIAMNGPKEEVLAQLRSNGAAKKTAKTS